MWKVIKINLLTFLVDPPNFLFNATWQLTKSGSHWVWKTMHEVTFGRSVCVCVCVWDTFSCLDENTDNFRHWIFWSKMINILTFPLSTVIILIIDASFFFFKEDYPTFLFFSFSTAKRWLWISLCFFFSFWSVLWISFHRNIFCPFSMFGPGIFFRVLSGACSVYWSGLKQEIDKIISCFKTQFEKLKSSMRPEGLEMASTSDVCYELCCGKRQLDLKL